MKARLDIPPSIINSVGSVLATFSRATVHYDPPAIESSADRFADVKDIALGEAIKSVVRSAFPNGLYTHQDKAVRSVAAGQNTVVATRTSSGKSVIYSLPVLDTLCHEGDATSLFIYPQKALANDQLLKLRDAVDAIPPVAEIARRKTHFVSRYDGATPSDCRPQIREEGQIILTNPDMLHVGLLQYHERLWSRFFRNLRHVAVDECHEYRGIFGTNFAYVLRRLRQVCRLHGSSPTFIATSATIREPREHMEKLTGEEFVCFGPEFDGSLQGQRKYWMVGSEEHFYEFGRKLALELAENGMTVLAFCASRLAAERMLDRVRPTREKALPFVRVYRAGLSALEREKIEQGLRDKTVRLVFSTSALELGIDIGEVDHVLRGI